MKTPTILRRDFLKAAAGVGLSPLLSGCTALDRAFMGQTGDQSDRVIILGAGMAGLRAAYELRKKGLPYRIFEGSHRIGGRAWTLDDLTPSGQSGEIGAEWFSSDQTVFWELAKELKLEIVEVKGQRDQLLLDQGAGALASIPVKDLTLLRANARKAQGLSSEKLLLQKNLEPWKAKALGRPTQSLSEWGKTLSEDRAWADLLESWAQFHYAMPAAIIRETAFTKTFLFHDSILDAWAGARYRFRGGSSSLSSAMLDRVMGAIPGDRLQMGYRLIKVEKVFSGFELHFDGPEGRRRYKARHVICTLPWAVLSKIDGFDDFAVGGLIRQPQVSQQIKGVMSFRERFWRKRWDQGRILNAEPYWESSYRVFNPVENTWGLVSGVWSGAKTQIPVETLSQQLLTRLQVGSDRATLPLVDQHFQNWSMSQWSGGRSAYPSLSRDERSFLTPEDGTWMWAGEHASGDSVGTWAGALESGASVTQKFSEGRPLPTA